MQIKAEDLLFLLEGKNQFVIWTLFTLTSCTFILTPAPDSRGPSTLQAGGIFTNGPSPASYHPNRSTSNPARAGISSTLLSWCLNVPGVRYLVLCITPCWFGHSNEEGAMKEEEEEKRKKTAREVEAAWFLTMGHELHTRVLCSLPTPSL